jgi:hypothetical protein
MKSGTAKITAILVLGLFLSACRPTQKDPPLDLDRTRQDTKVDTITVDASSSLGAIGTPAIWKRTTGKNVDGARVKIALVGSGIDYTIPDLREALWINSGEIGEGKATNLQDNDGNGYVNDVIGYDFYSGDSFPYDWHGADTYTASVIAATAHANQKVVGLAPNAELIIARYIGPDGTGSGMDAVPALEYATAMGAKVIYFNWPQGGFKKMDTDLVLQTLKEMEAKGVVVVMPAGNSSNQEVPVLLRGAAKLTNVIIVAGFEKDGKLTNTTNSGKNLATIGAPVDATGYLPGGVVSSDLRNTSAAAAYVTAAAALLSTMPKLGNAQKIRAELMSQAQGRKDGEAPDVLAQGGVYLGNY